MSTLESESQTLLSMVTIKELAHKYDYFLLDCDGVIWSGDV
jgi:hypothetical protein